MRTAFSRLPPRSSKTAKRKPLPTLSSRSIVSAYFVTSRGIKTYTVKVGKDKFPALHDGHAKLTFTAKSNDLRGSEDSVTYPVTVNLTPPHVSADGEQHYINQGGSELVTFTPTGYVTDSGVKVGKYTFRQLSDPEPPGQRYSLFAYPWDLDEHVAPYCLRDEPAGTEARATFTYRLFPKKFRDP